VNLLLREIRHNKLLWLLVFVPAVFVAQELAHEAHTLLFALSLFAIVPLAALPNWRRTDFPCPPGCAWRTGCPWTAAIRVADSRPAGRTGTHVRRTMS
jgi:hypothetical protein